MNFLGSHAERSRVVWSATDGELPERGVEMGKKAGVLGLEEETNDKEDEAVESQPVPPYRIICNSEHFIVLNPVQRKRPKETVRIDEEHKEAAGPSKRFQGKIESAREKGRILRPFHS